MLLSLVELQNLEHGHVSDSSPASVQPRVGFSPDEKTGVMLCKVYSVLSVLYVNTKSLSHFKESGFSQVLFRNIWKIECTYRIFVMYKIGFHEITGPHYGAREGGLWEILKKKKY